MSWRTNVPASVLLGLGTMLLGCTEATPSYCAKNADCSGGRVCDVARAVCVQPDAAAGALDGAREAGLSTEVRQPIDGRPAEARDADQGDGSIDAPAAEDAPAAVDGSTLDQAEADVPLDSAAIEAPAPDTAVPDGAGTCGSNGDCPDPAKAFCVGNLCVGCQAAGATACGSQACDAVSGKCVQCTTDVHCSKDVAKGFCVANACTGCSTPGATGCAAHADGKLLCAASGSAVGQCVECLADTDCKDATKSFCVANACSGCQAAPATACSTRAPAKPVCSSTGTLLGQCVECSADTDCKDPAKSFCVANACVACQGAPAAACSTRSAAKPVCATAGALGGQCVACMTDGDCTTATAPICNLSNACVPCTADSQCVAKSGGDPGVCMAHQDGRCATDAETIYVANVAGCAPSGSASGGTASQPLCGLQAAAGLLSTSKDLIVLRSASDVVTVTRAAQVSIVGQAAASIATGVLNAGITLSGTGNLYARDLSVIGSSVSNVGISAGAGTTLRLERVKVLNNGGGGILLNGAAFDLREVLVSGNGTGIDGSTTWSGIYVKALPNAGAATTLSLVSVENNGSPGVNCTFAIPAGSASAATVFASANGGTSGINVIPTCGITPCTPALAGVCGSSLTP